MLTAPGPGVYEGVSFKDYASWPYLNNSGLTRFLRSPAHYKAGLDTDDDTAAKTRGTLCHAGILEPARFGKEYAIGPDVKLNTKSGKDEWEAFVAATPGKCHVRGADGAAMLGCREAIWSHRWAVELLRSEGPSEVCIVWDDAATGLRCKARVDKAATGPASCAVDLKTTRDARREAFERSIWTYGYHRQAAFTLHGLAALGMTLDKFYIIPIEPEPPYALMVYEVEHAAIEAGRVEIVAGMVDFAECRRLDKWPGYSEAPEFIGLPPFTRRREGFETQTQEVGL